MNDIPKKIRIEQTEYENFNTDEIDAVKPLFSLYIYNFRIFTKRLQNIQGMCLNTLRKKNVKSIFS